MPLRTFASERSFDAARYPGYAIRRVLELGDADAVSWMQSTYTRERIAEAVKYDAKLSRRSATFWGLVYRVPPNLIAALGEPRASWRDVAADA